MQHETLFVCQLFLCEIKTYLLKNQSCMLTSFVWLLHIFSLPTCAYHNLIIVFVWSEIGCWMLLTMTFVILDCQFIILQSIVWTVGSIHVFRFFGNDDILLHTLISTSIPSNWLIMIENMFLSLIKATIVISFFFCCCTGLTFCV